MGKGWECSQSWGRLGPGDTALREHKVLNQEGKTTSAVISRFSDCVPALCLITTGEPLAACHLPLPPPALCCAATDPQPEPQVAGYAVVTGGSRGFPTLMGTLWGASTVIVTVTVKETETQRDFEWLQATQWVRAEPDQYPGLQSCGGDDTIAV